MNLSARQDGIVSLLHAKGVVSVDTLATHFGVTPQTIRRDLNHLYEANLLKRRHGGAEPISRPQNESFYARRISRLKAKEQIAAVVAGLIPSGASLLIGFGTTPEQVAMALADHNDLTVVTNNLCAALALTQNMSNNVVLPGGQIRQPNPEILGAEAVQLFSDFKADFGISGVGGLDTDGALLDFDMDEANCHRALRSNCRQRILVLDHSKFGRLAPVRSGSLVDVDVLVTDREIAPAFRALIPERAQVFVASEVRV